MPTNLTKARSFSIVIIAYLLAYIASVGILLYSGIEDPIWNMAAADFAATVIIFIFSIFLRNSSMYDPYWSVYPIFIAFWWLAEFGDGGNAIRNILATLLVTAWGVRLTFNWARGWPGMVHEDWRYTKLSEDTGPMYWLVSFLGIHLFPTVLVFLGCVPLFYIYQDPSGLGIFDFIAFVVTAGAILIETIADNQLRAFKLNRKEGEPRIINSGLWSWSRHPNYFGEIMFWVGIFIFSMPVFMGGEYWIISGMAGMIILFVFISIPMMEKRESRKEGYDKYQKQVSFLIPLPPKKSK